MIDKDNEQRLKDIIDVRDGTHDSPKYVNEGYPLITSKNIVNGKIDFTNVNLISQEDYEKINKRSEVKKGDIIMPMIGTIGNPVIVDTDKKFAIKNVALFKFDSGKDLINNYLFYYLKSDYFYKQIHLIKRGGTQSFISLSDIRNLKVPIFNINYQQKVVDVLKKAESLINIRKAQITALSDLTQSVFFEMFGDPKVNPMNWEIHCLGELVENLNSKRIPIKEADRKKIQGDFPYYGATGIVDYINDYKLEGEYLLVSEDGKALESRNKPIAFLVSGKFWVNNHAHILAYNGKCNLRYLSIYIENISIKNYVTGIDQYKLNRANLDKIPVMCPPIELQERYNDILVKIEEQKSVLIKGLKEIENYYNSLLQNAFKGELFND